LQQPSSSFFHCKRQQGIMGKISRVLFPDADNDDVSTHDKYRKTNIITRCTTTTTTTRSRVCTTNKGDSLAHLCQTANVVDQGADISKVTKNTRGMRGERRTRIGQGRAEEPAQPSLSKNTNCTSNSGANERMLRSQARNRQKVLRSRKILKERSVLSELSSLQNSINGNRDNTSNKRGDQKENNKIKKNNRKSKKSAKDKQNEGQDMNVHHKQSSRCNQFNTCVLECLPSVEQTQLTSSLSCAPLTPNVIEEVSLCTSFTHDDCRRTITIVPSCKESIHRDHTGTTVVISTSNEIGTMDSSKQKSVDDLDLYSPSVAPKAAKRMDCKKTPLHEIKTAEASVLTTAHFDCHTTTPIVTASNELKGSDHLADGVEVFTSNVAGTLELSKNSSVDDSDLLYSPSVAPRAVQYMNDNFDRCDDHEEAIECSPTNYDETCRHSRRNTQEIMVGINLLSDMNKAHSESHRDGGKSDNDSQHLSNTEKDKKWTKLCFDCQSLDERSPSKSFEFSYGDHSKTSKDPLMNDTVSGVEHAKTGQENSLDVTVDTQLYKAKDDIDKLMDPTPSAERTETSRTIRRSSRNSKPVNRLIVNFKRRSKRQKSHSNDQLIKYDSNKQPPPLDEVAEDTANVNSQTNTATSHTMTTVPMRRSNRVPQPVQRFTINFKKKNKKIDDDRRKCTDNENVPSKVNENVVSNSMTGEEESESRNQKYLKPQEAEVDSEGEDDIFDEELSNQEIIRHEADVELPIKNNEYSRSKPASKRQPKVAEVSSGVQDDILTNSKWPQNLVALLQQAHSSANPMSSTFWYDIAEHIEGKSAEECRDKWFDMFQTSEPLQKNSSKEAHTDTEDDIFNSTPFKTKTRDDYLLSPASSQKDSHRLNAFNKLSNLFSSPILQRRKGFPSAQDAEDEKSPLFLRFQYKTYLKEVRAGIHNKIVSRSKKSEIPKVKKSCMVSLEEGDIELGGSLSPGGTLHIQAPEEEELEELYAGQSEYDDDDDA